MVRWYQPLLLLRTGIRALLATVIGQLADNRELQAMDHRPQSNDWDFRDLPTTASNDLWFDFVADMGDGWDPAHAVACAVAAPTLEVDGETLPRANLLLLGGDLVYPDPSIDAYQQRTLAPWRTACAGAPEFSAQVFAVPGNHDWYDGLHAFQDLFCHDPEDASEYPFGAWQKPQTHSYFAWQLPHGWWLLAPDVQLDDRLNPAQRAYFRRVIAAMQSGDRVVLVAPYPNWSQVEPNAGGSVSRWLVAQCQAAGARVPLVLTGDLHHYARYAQNELNPTHTLANTVALDGLAEQDGVTFTRQHTYPPARTSHRLSLRNLLFPISNWELSLFAGFVYTMLAWVLETRLLVGDAKVSELFQQMLESHGGIGETLTRVVGMLPKSPEFALVVLLTAIGLTAFNENCRYRTRLLLGALHTILHLSGLILTYCVAVELTTLLYNQIEALSFSFFWFLLLMVVLGGGVGGVVIGAYLTLSLNLFGANLTNAFSSLRIAEYKNFLRLRLTGDGELVVYPLGIDEPTAEPARVHAIESPVRIR